MILERFYKGLAQVLMTAVVAVVLAIFFLGIYLITLVLGLDMPFYGFLVFFLIFEFLAILSWLIVLLPRVTRRIEAWWT